MGVSIGKLGCGSPGDGPIAISQERTGKERAQWEIRIYDYKELKNLKGRGMNAVPPRSPNADPI